jgi:dephospho-CoA kinase
MTSAPNVSDGFLRLLPNIAFMGKMGAGKTVAASYVAREYPYFSTHFATELKRIAVRLFGPEALTNRGLLQDLGRKMRELDPMVWVNVTLRDVTADGIPYNAPAYDSIPHAGRKPGDTVPVVIDDLRFPNEYHELRKREFVIVKVTAHRNQRLNRLRANGKLQDESQLGDISETALDEHVADYTITNTTTQLELGHTVQDILEREVRKRA